MEREFKKETEWLDKLTLYTINPWLFVPCGSSVQLQPCAGSVGIPYPFSSLERMQIAVSDSCQVQPIARGDGTEAVRELRSSSRLKGGSVIISFQRHSSLDVRQRVVDKVEIMITRRVCDSQESTALRLITRVAI